MQKAYLASTIFLLSLMIIGIIWVTYNDIVKKIKKRNRKKKSKKT